MQRGEADGPFLGMGGKRGRGNCMLPGTGGGGGRESHLGLAGQTKGLTNRGGEWVNFGKGLFLNRPGGGGDRAPGAKGGKCSIRPRYGGGGKGAGGPYNRGGGDGGVVSVVERGGKERNRWAGVEVSQPGKKRGGGGGSVAFPDRGEETNGTTASFPNRRKRKMCLHVLMHEKKRKGNCCDKKKKILRKR